MEQREFHRELQQQGAHTRRPHKAGPGRGGLRSNGFLVQTLLWNQPGLATCGRYGGAGAPEVSQTTPQLRWSPTWKENTLSKAHKQT